MVSLIRQYHRVDGCGGGGGGGVGVGGGGVGVGGGGLPSLHQIAVSYDPPTLLPSGGGGDGCGAALITLLPSLHQTCGVGTIHSHLNSILTQS